MCASSAVGQLRLLYLIGVNKTTLFVLMKLNLGFQVLLRISGAVHALAAAYVLERG